MRNGRRERTEQDSQYGDPDVQRLSFRYVNHRPSIAQVDLVAFMPMDVALA
jgi:hypothetical protein